ncbi:MAG: fluoride efflux transporter CrcB [Acidobacteriota bacterium]
MILKTALVNAALVGSGGFVGALFRYGMSGWVHRKIPLTTFPYGTLTVNLLGCLLIGIFAGLMDSRQLFTPEVRRLALIGFLGGFTTYSAFGYETFAMIRDAEHLRATINVGLHLVLGLSLVWVGYGMAMSR